jgi:hypothetical protein
VSTVTWDYDGASTLQATVSGTNGLLTYFLTSFDPASSVVSHVGTGGDLVLTVTDIGGLSAGDEFYAEVNCDGEQSVRDANVFMYGTPTTTGIGYPVTWSFDGTTGVTVSFTATTSASYKLRAIYYAGGGILQATQNFGGGSPGTVGTTLTIGLTPSAGKPYIAAVLANTGQFAVAARVFTGGVADTGAEGSPTTGGTDTGQPVAGPTGPTGSTGPPATTGYAPTFTVTNMAQDGTEISTFTPIGGTLRWTYRICQSGGPGDGQWAIALSDPSIVIADQFAPYRTDWKITMHYPGEPDEDLIAGILTPVNTGSEPSGVFGQVRVTGKDWLHWLEQPYPFDYAAVVADVVTNQLLDPANLFKQWIGQTQETIVGDLITALDGNVGAVVFGASYEGTGWTLTLDKEVAFGDNTTLLDLILDIAKLATVGTDQYGFDMWCDPDKTVHLVAPRVTDPNTVVPLFTLDDSNVVAPPLDWTNNGPLETDSVVFGQANNNTARIGFSDYPASQAVYRQWTQFQQVSLAEEDAIAAAAAGVGLQDRFPQKNLKITIRPDLLDPLDPRVGFRNHLGQAILVHYPIDPYHTIFADFYIVEQAYYTPDGCNWLCDLTLQQIYTADANPDTS